MENNKVDLFLLNKGGLFPDAQLPLLRDLLTKADEDKWPLFFSASFRNPTTALILSITVGTYGADRFYLGQPLLGIGKLLVTILFFIWLLTIEFIDEEGWFIFFTGLAMGPVLVLWYFIDIFLVSRLAKKQNLNILLTLLN